MEASSTKLAIGSLPGAAFSPPIVTRPLLYAFPPKKGVNRQKSPAMAGLFFLGKCERSVSAVYSETMLTNLRLCGPLVFELHKAVVQSEQRVVATQANVCARVENACRADER